jgi:hypothetical protein
MMRLNEVKVKRDKIEGREKFFHFHSWKWGMGEKNGGRANLIKQRRYDLVPGIQKVYTPSMYTLCTPKKDESVYASILLQPRATNNVYNQYVCLWLERIISSAGSRTDNWNRRNKLAETTSATY